MQSNARLIFKEAKKRGWKFELIDPNESFGVLTLKNGHKEYLHSSLTNFSGAVSCEIVNDKFLFDKILERINLPKPETILYSNLDRALDFLEKEKVIVVKPRDTDHGKGVSLKIDNKEALMKAVEKAKTFSKDVILQKYYKGKDYRFLIVAGKTVAVSYRKPAFVVGDGINTIKELIKKENNNSLRGDDHELPLTKIHINEASHFLGDKINIIPPKNDEVFVMDVANLSKGGTSIDVTGTVSSEMKSIAEKCANEMGLFVAGVDIISENITTSLPESKSVILEVNKMPGLRMHHFPSQGKKTNVIKYVFDAIESRAIIK